VVSRSAIALRSYSPGHSSWVNLKLKVIISAVCLIGPVRLLRVRGNSFMRGLEFLATTIVNVNNQVFLGTQSNINSNGGIQVFSINHLVLVQYYLQLGVYSLVPQY
jgi:hypothetical protein